MKICTSEQMAIHSPWHGLPARAKTASATKTICSQKSLLIIESIAWAGSPCHERPLFHHKIIRNHLLLKWALLFLILGSTACGSHAHSVTESDATFQAASAHQLIVTLPSHGDFTNSRSIPLDTKVVVKINGRESNIGKLQAGQNIRILRDDVTHEVVGIEAR